MKPWLRLTLAALLLVSVPAGRAAAEVSVILNPAGQVVRMTSEPDAAGNVWLQFSDLPPAQVLNRLGDQTGDLRPACGVIALPMDDPLSLRAGGGRSGGNASGGSNAKGGPQQRRAGIAVWPRWDGHDWELVYAVWDYRTWSWTAPAYIESADNLVDDLDPILIIHGKRVSLIWHRGSGATGADTMLSTMSVVESATGYTLTWNPPIAVAPDSLDGSGELNGLGTVHSAEGD